MSREAAYVALFAQLQTVAGITTFGRRVRLLEDIKPPEFPCLFMTVGTQTVVPKPGVPPKRTLGARIFIYTAAPDATVASAIQLNALVDAVEAALKPLGMQPQQTLAGAVAHAWIEGKIEIYEAIKTQRAAALIPITMLMP